LGSVDWSLFEDWLLKAHDRVYVRKLLNDAQKYCFVFKEPGRASVVGGLSRDRKRSVMAALANLAKYLGMYDYWKAVARNSGLRWEKRPAIETVLDILNSDLDTLEEWLMHECRILPKEHASVLGFMAVTGLRPSEACMSTLLISELTEEDRLDQYFNAELMMLEHFRYPKLFLRNVKNCYISFVPGEMLDLIQTVRPQITYVALKHALQKREQRIRLKDMRHLYATKLREHLPREVIDLLQGRVGQSIFLRHYYKPYLGKIQRKVFRAISPLTNDLLAALT
jgi:integrase